MSTYLGEYRPYIISFHDFIIVILFPPPSPPPFLYWQPKPGSALGGPYLAVHLRREDYARSKRKEVATLPRAAEQIKAALIKYDLRKVFVATDAPKHGKFAIQSGKVSGEKKKTARAKKKTKINRSWINPDLLK